MRLRLSGYLAAFADGRPWVEVALPAPRPLRDVLASLKIPAGEIYLVVVNGQLQEAAEILVSETDEVQIFPPLDGGKGALR